MEKRSWTSWDGASPGPDGKRPKSAPFQDTASALLPTEDPGAVVEAEFFMEQRLVGWIIGRGGATLKDVEQAYGVQISVDQSTKDQGYSKLKVSGEASFVQQAAEHMNSSLARAVVGRGDGGPTTAIGPFLMDAPPVPGPEMYEELHIEQRFVGWLLGKSGSVAREIETASGCKICMNQGTRHLGFTVAQLHGSDQQRAHARQLMEVSLERARGSGGDSAPHVVEEDLQVEQKWVGWLLGKGGGLAKEIEQESGAKVTIDQSTKTLGWSTVKIVGGAPQVEAAKMRVTASLQKVGGQAVPINSSVEGDAGAMQVQIDQQWIGWLLGKGGTVVKEIEAASGGAKVSINQDTKAAGYSIATITGTSQQVTAAYEQMGEKLRRVNPSGDGLVPLQTGTQPAATAPASHAVAAGIVQQIAASITRAQGSGTLAAGAGAGSGSFGRSFEEMNQTLELQIEQKWVGWLLGSGGKTVREIESETGCSISIDQSFKDMGFSTVKVTGSSVGVELAQQRIQNSLSLVAPSGTAAVPVATAAQDAFAAAEASPAASEDAFATEGYTAASEGELHVEQKWVGWLLGKSGIVLKEIEMQSGASVKIDQSTKDMGFSTVRIVGDWQQSAMARQLIQDKIAQAHPAGPRQ